ncbi:MULTISPECIES: MATE family efflux transporter [unclassified Anaerobiospirillum]|uniref:MATE family efflux transporter n=1 Tax=unclassified Anaerobiospirillum TaxID=2647410 RepID=UPI001FF363E1|nr:MATE family efflux transporter [Anaerobiospirillum sp. NML120511]MCK0541099.1 MATE family efflux transporter [Anaerobiospirillum sp. NML02-A-032]
MRTAPESVTSQLIVLFKLAFPIILGNFAYALLGITDIMMAGMAGTPDQAGVAVGGSFFFPAMTFIIGMISALHPVISRHCGANTREKIPAEHIHSVLACIIVAALLMVLLLGLSFFAIDMDADQRMEDIAKEYVIYIAFTMPLLALTVNARAYCEAMGNTRATFYFGNLAVVLNVPLNYVFIFGKFGMPELGGAGCGAASLVAMAISTVIIYSYVMLHPQLKNHSWLKNRDRISLDRLKSFLKLSLPLGISSSVECSCFTLIALLLSPLGPMEVSAHTITMSLTNFVFNIPLSLGIASSIMVGYAIGRNSLTTLRHNIQASYASMLFSIVVSVAILFFGSEALPALFSKDPQVLALASTLMLFAAVNQSFEGIQTIQAFILRGFKDTASILLVTVIAFYCVALPLGYTLCYGYLILPGAELFFEEGLTGPRGFWIGLLAGLLAASILYRIRVLHHWRDIKSKIAAAEASPQSPASAGAAP